MAKLPLEIKTVGDIRAAVAGYGGIIDVWWMGSFAKHLLHVIGARFAISDTYVEGQISTIEDLLKCLDGLPDARKVYVSYESDIVSLTAIGPSGENVDFSFYVEPTSR